MKKRKQAGNDGFNGYIKVPKALFLDPRYHWKLSPIAILLYGFLADRAGLSARQGSEWRDEDQNVFVYYSLAETQERFRCCHDTAANAMKQLEEAGLIRRDRHRNTYIIVVLKTDELLGLKITPEDPLRQDRISPDGSIDEIDANKTEDNKPEQNNTDSIMSPRSLEEQIKENIAYDVLIQWNGSDKIDGIVELMVDNIQADKPVKIRNQTVPAARLRQRLLASDDMDIQYVLDAVKREQDPIRNMQGYILARLYDTKAVKDFFYENLVSCDTRTGQM